MLAINQVLGKGSLAALEAYVSLALKAGFRHTLDGHDPLILDLNGSGLDIVRRDPPTARRRRVIRRRT